MTHKSSYILASIAAFGAISSPLVHAAPVNPPAYTAGDIFMGFRATGGQGASDVYVVNIGSAATFRDATSTVTPGNLGDINADLTNLYGSNWQTRTDLVWGIAGTPSNTDTVGGDAAPTLYASKVLNTVGSPGTGWSIAGSSTRTTVATTMTTFQSNFTLQYESSSNSSRAVVQADGDSFSWRKFMASGGDSAYTTGNKDFGGFSEIEALPSQKLSLFRVNGSSAGTYKGYFAISASGVLTFTPPSTGTSYATWAAANASNQAANLDTDNDGVPNGVEWFTGSSVNPQIVSGVITWPRASGTATATSVKVQTSTNLTSWTDVVTGLQSGTGSISYTLPTGQARIFVRLNVTP